MKFKASEYIGNADAVILILFLLYGVFSQYFILSALGGLTLVVILRNLWKPYVPPALLIFVSFHWLQVFASILYADFIEKSSYKPYSGDDTEYLFGITFLQIMLMSYVLRNYVFDSRHNATYEMLKESAEKLNSRNVIIGYAVSAVVLPVLVAWSWRSPSLFQLVSTFNIVKLIFTGLMVFILLLKKTKNKLLIGGILLFDFVISFASFFSGFKILIILIILIYITVNPHIKKSALLKLSPFVIILVIFFSFWSYVKGGYREFLNQGSSQQVKAVSNSQALSYMYSRVVDIKLSELRQGAAIFLKRLQYMERYTEAYNRVPSEIEYQNGKELASTLEFIFVPRALNPNKGVKDASERTSYYTGKDFTKASQGTSISMGYMCDLYIDFGLYLMIIPLLLITAVIGYIYRSILNVKGYNKLFVYTLLGGVFLSLGTFESDMIFFLGVIRNNVAFLILGFLTFFPALNKFVQAKK